MTLQGNLSVCLVIAGLAISVIHLFRWPREMHRVLAYCVGTATIWLGVFLYLGPSPLFWELAWFPAVVGVVVLALKGWGQAQTWVMKAITTIRQADDDEGR